MYHELLDYFKNAAKTGKTIRERNFNTLELMILGLVLRDFIPTFRGTILVKSIDDNGRMKFHSVIQDLIEVLANIENFDYDAVISWSDVEFLPRSTNLKLSS